MSSVERIRYCSLGIMDWYDWGAVAKFVGFSSCKKHERKPSQNRNLRFNRAHNTQAWDYIIVVVILAASLVVLQSSLLHHIIIIIIIKWDNNWSLVIYVNWLHDIIASLNIFYMLLWMQKFIYTLCGP
jgi:hypothetical protein